MSAQPALPRPDASRIAVPAPGQPEPLEREPAAARWLALPGFAILVGCLEAGELVKAKLGLILPGNILGLFLLLALLGTGLVPLRWVENAARLLLWLQPLLFVPVFVPTIQDRGLWLVQGRSLAGAIVLGTALLWAVVGHGSQWLLKKAQGRRQTGVRDRSRSDNVEGESAP